MKKLLLLLFPLGALAADPRGVLVSSTHVLTYPTDFFTINSNLIVEAIGGALGGGGGVGTVTSVNVSGGSTGMSFSGGPITSSGTISLGGTLGLAYGGTGATDASGARTALSLVPGVNYVVWDADLDTLATRNGSILTNLNASALTSGTVPIARIASGTPDGTKFIRDDGVLATVSTSGGQPASAALTNLSNASQPGQVPVVASTGVLGMGNVGDNVGYWTSGPVRIVAMGDSLTAGTGGTPYTTPLATLIPGNYSVVTNGGVPGQTIYTLSTGYTNNVKFWAASGGTNVILNLWEGVNDIGLGSNAVNTFTVWSNVVNWAHADGMKVCAFTISSSMQFPGNYEKERIEYNDLIRRSPMWDYLVDLDQWMPNPPHESYYSDYIHLTTVGYARVAMLVNEVYQRGFRNRFQYAYGSNPSVVSGYGLVRNLNTSLHVGASDNVGITLEKVSAAGVGTDVFTTHINGNAVKEFFHIGSGNISAADFYSYRQSNQFTVYRPFSVVGSGGLSNTVAYFARPQIAKTTNYTLLQTEAGLTVNNNGAVGATIHTLPAAYAGAHYGLAVVAAQSNYFRATGSATIQNAASTGAANGAIVANAVGSTIHLFCPVDGKWFVDQSTGTWTLE